MIGLNCCWWNVSRTLWAPTWRNHENVKCTSWSNNPALESIPLWLADELPHIFSGIRILRAPFGDCLGRFRTFGWRKYVTGVFEGSEALCHFQCALSLLPVCQLRCELSAATPSACCLCLCSAIMDSYSSGTVSYKHTLSSLSCLGRSVHHSNGKVTNKCQHLYSDSGPGRSGYLSNTLMNCVIS